MKMRPWLVLAAVFGLTACLPNPRYSAQPAVTQVSGTATRAVVAVTPVASAASAMVEPVNTQVVLTAASTATQIIPTQAVLTPAAPTQAAPAKTQASPAAAAAAESPATQIMPTQAALTPAASTQVAPTEVATAAQAALTASPGATPTLSSDDVIQAVQVAWAAYDKAGPRHITQTFYKNNQEVSRLTIDAVPPDQAYIVTVNAGQTGSVQYIYNGIQYANSVAYNNTWIKVGSFTPAQYAQVVGSLDPSVKITFSSGQVVGRDSVNGEPTVVYSYVTEVAGSPNRQQNKVWVSVARGLPLKMEKLGNNDEEVMQEITYDPSLKITLPADVAAAKSIQH